MTQGQLATLFGSSAVFLVALELTIVAVALPALIADVTIAKPQMSVWIFAAYNMVVASLLLLFGSLADRIGRRKVFVRGILLFALGSLGSGLAPTIEVLIGARIIQGLGGAMMIPASLALILAKVDLEERDRAIGVWGAMAGVAAALGPILGGLLVDTLGWRSVFLCNVPIALIAAFCCVRWLTESRAQHSVQPIDWVAMPVGAMAVGLGVFLLAPVSSDGLVTELWLLCVSAIVVLGAVFIFRILRHANPAFDPAIARQPSFAWSGLGTLLFVAGFTAWIIAVPTFLVSVWDYSSSRASFAIAPAAIAMAVVAQPAARIAQYWGHGRVVALGAFLSLAGLIFWQQILSEMPNYFAVFLPGALLFGAGVGCSFPMLAAGAMRDVPTERYAMGAAGNTTLRQLGASVGAALAVGLTMGLVTSATGASAATVLQAHRELWFVISVLCVTTILVGLCFPVDREPLSENKFRRLPPQANLH